MTQLVEDITIKITLNHCEGDGVALGGPNDLKKWAADFLEEGAVTSFILSQAFTDTFQMPGLDIVFERTGLYERAEVGGGDN
jgi:hypothetical protein